MKKSKIKLLKTGKKKSPFNNSTKIKKKTNKKKIKYSSNPSEVKSLIRELQQHDIELEMQNEKLQISFEKVNTLLDKYTGLYDFAPISYFTFDRDSVVHDCNLAASELLGIERLKLLNKKFLRFFSKDSLPVFNNLLKKIFKSKQKLSCEITLSDIARKPIHTRIEIIASKDGKKCHAVLIDLTEKKFIENELQNKQALLTIFMENISEPIYIKDVESRILIANPALASIAGKPLNEIIGKTDSEYYNNKIVGGALRKNDLQVIKSGKSMTFEEIVFKKEKPLSFISVKAPFKDAYNNIIGIIGISYDITERKKIENDLRNSEESSKMLADFLESSQQPFGVGYPDGSLGYINKAFENLTGYNRDELQSMDWSKTLTPPEWRDIENKSLKKLIRTGQPVYYEKEYIRKNGTRVPIELLVHLIKDENGKPLHFYSFITDLTERKQLENLYKKKADELQVILDSVPAMVFYKDTENHFVRTNNAFEKTMKLTKEELEGKSLFDIYSLEIAEKYWSDDKQVIATRKPRLGIIEPMETSEGLKWVQTDKIPLINEQGKIIGIIGLSVDITERKKAEEELRESEERFKVIASSTPDHVLVQDKELRYTLVVNPQMGFKEEDMIGKTDFDFLSKEDAVNLTSIKLKVLETRQPLHIETSLSSRNNQLEYFDGSYVPKFDSKGNVDGLIGYFKNITERKKMEEALRESEERFRSLYNTMTEGMALHEMISDESGNYIDYKILEVNPSFEKITGIKREKAIGQLTSKLYGSGSPPFLDIYAKVTLTGESIEFENEFQPMQKSFSISVFSPEKGKFATVFSDITERKKWEEDIRKFTLELQQKNEELTRFNNAMVGRELRMMELKKEINELCNKTGEPFRYLNEERMEKKDIKNSII